MGYTEDRMQDLVYALKRTDGLKNSLKEFNDNIQVFRELLIAIQEQNELKRIEIGLMQRQLSFTEHGEHYENKTNVKKLIPTNSIK